MRKIDVLGEERVQRLVELLRRGEVAAERLLDDDARALGAARAAEPVDHRRERARRDREVVERPPRGAERLADVAEELPAAVVAADEDEPLGEHGERRLVDAAAVRRDALARTLDEPRLVQRLAPDADHGHVERAALRHRVQRREDLLEREVAARAEHDERIGAFGLHQEPAFFSTCPPNSKRIAESTWCANSASPRDAKRS